MNIRPKVAALTAGIFVVLGMAEVLVEKQVVMPSFAELERANARVALRRINFALDLVIDRVAVPAADWGNWVDSYRFMQDRNPDFISTGITNVALRQLNVNVMLMLDADGGVPQIRPAARVGSGRPQGSADRLPVAGEPARRPPGARAAADEPWDPDARGCAGARRQRRRPGAWDDAHGAASLRLGRQEPRRPGAGRPDPARAGSEPGARATHRG
ncbi:MAG: hypothetical protein E6K23_05735 [Gammaproteobacteria bacterium]|nr:MAG: hypothetical protein E6K23_05735 [Gammaproteobacteria bacterium]